MHSPHSLSSLGGFSLTSGVLGLGGLGVLCLGVDGGEGSLMGEGVFAFGGVGGEIDLSGVFSFGPP